MTPPVYTDPTITMTDVVQPTTIDNVTSVKKDDKQSDINENINIHGYFPLEQKSQVNIARI